jgi:hypothetical protein
MTDVHRPCGFTSDSYAVRLLSTQLTNGYCNTILYIPTGRSDGRFNRHVCNNYVIVDFDE